MIKSSFGFAMPSFMPEHRLYANDLAGGGILDVGGYPVSMARLIAGAAVGKPFARARQGRRHRPSRPVRRRRVGLGGAAFPQRHRRRGVLRHLAQPGQRAAHPRHQGPHRGAGLLVRRRQPRRRAGQDRRHRSTASARPSAVNETRHLYSFEVDAAGEAIRAGRQEFAWPGMSWADSLGNLRVLDKWRADAGLEYGIEKAARRVNTISGRKLRIRRHGAFRKRKIPGFADRLGGRARLRGFPHLLVRRDPARRLLRGRRQSVRHRLASMAPATPRSCSANG